MTKLSDYVIKEEDFFKLEDTFNMTLLKKLASQNIFQEKQNEDNVFIKLTLKQIEELKGKFIPADFPYRQISILFEEENKDIFLERLRLLFSIYDLNNNNGSNNDLILTIFETCKSKFNDKKKILNELKLIYDDYSTFFPNMVKNDLEELENLINQIKDENINLVLSDYENKIKSYKSQYLNSAEERAKLKESILFKLILLKERNNKKEDDAKILKDSTNKFYEIKELFRENDFNFNNEKIIEKFIKELNDRGEEEIREELNRLIDIFNIKIENDKKEEGINNIILLSNKDRILEISESVKIFIEESGALQEEYINILNSIIDNSKDNIGIDYIKMCLEILKSLDIDLYNKENRLPGIFLKFKKRPEIIKFLISKNFEDCRVLQDISNNNENTFLTPADILDFEKCVQFMNNLGTQEKINIMSDYELIQKSKIFSENNPEFELNLSNFIDHYNQIKEIIERKFNKHEAANQKIEKIFNKSFFILSNEEKNFFNGNIDGNDISLADLQELRDRIIISTNIYTSSNLNENLKQIYQQYVRLVSELLKIKEKLNEIYNIGYTRDIDIQISLDDSNLSFCFSSPQYLANKYNKENKNIEDIVPILNEILNDVKNDQKKGYKENAYLRFLFGRQFYHLYNLLAKKNYKYDIIPFLNFITNNNIKNKDYKMGFNWEEDKDNYNKVLNNCSKYIKNIFDKNKIELNNIYEISKIQSIPEIQYYQGFYVYSCSQVEKDLFQLYKYLTGNIPIAQNILLCNKETSNEEITSFLYRSILCEYHSCFIIGGIESLNFSQKNHFLEILNQLLFEKMKSCLIILSIDKGTEIYKTLDSIKYKNTFPSKIENELKSITLNNLDNIRIISSDKSGVGKTTQIKKNISKMNKKYIYFPVGGVFTRKSIIDRLHNLELTENCAIHLDLYDTDRIDLMMEFLFGILITKIYKVNEDFFYLPKNINIQIEIPNGFVSFKYKFPILDLIPENQDDKLYIDKLCPLIVPKELDSNIQIVCNYLKLLKNGKIINFDLNIPNVTPKDLANLPTNIQATSISPNEAQTLIFELIKNKNSIPLNLSYYQISSLIDLLAAQFKKLNQNFFLNPFYLINKQIRPLIIEGFINLSLYCIDGAFTKLINEQNITHNMVFGEYKENDDIQNGLNELIDNLSKEDHSRISFDRINHPLLFFNEGVGQGFTIITNKSPEDKEYIKYLELKKVNAKKEELKII